MANNYIILRDSIEQAAWEALSPEQQADPANFQGKKFAVIEPDFAPEDRKTGRFTETIGGVLDYAVAPIFYVWQGVIRTSHSLEPSVAAAGFGTLADLQRYTRLNTPNPVAGSPSTIVTLVNHSGVELEGFLQGNTQPKHLTTMIEGIHAHFMVPLVLAKREAIA